MKQIIIPVALILLFSMDSGAQKVQRMGPAAKNYKPWKDESGVSTVLVNTDDSAMGPKAKNRKRWLNDCQMYPILFVERRELQGPEAKNSGPERNNYRRITTIESR